MSNLSILLSLETTIKSSKYAPGPFIRMWLFIADFLRSFLVERVIIKCLEVATKKCFSDTSNYTRSVSLSLWVFFFKTKYIVKSTFQLKIHS